MKNTLLIFILLLGVSNTVQAEKETKGLLPELRINSLNEDENQKKSLQSEILITKTENKAINSLLNIVKKRKGSSEEPDLWNRLAELYMRRAKSGRFFDLNRNGTDQAIKFAPPEVVSETAINNLKKAIQIYAKIEREFPKFKDIDAVLFNSAFANQQVNQKKLAEQTYIKLIANHPKSSLIPDAYLSLGEIKYEAHNFSGALDSFLAIQKYPHSRVFSYGNYKAAWAYYNLHQTDKAIEKLIEVVKLNGKKENKLQSSHNLRQEALRDLTIFFGETSTPEKAFDFFSLITTNDELGETLINLGKLYDSHSRHKEMNVFLNDFIKRQPNSPKRIQAQILLIQANEALKNRKEVLKQLKTLNTVCQKDSPWSLENPQTYDESCNFDFAKANIDIAKKWWDLWLKNKQVKELADLTRQAFKIHLDREDPLKPDSKSRYAYAELLFQLEDFKVASQQYTLVADKTTDSQLKHDANYAALVAFEKGSAKKKEVGDEDQIVALSDRYLKNHPNGEHVLQVQFKIGFVAYEKQNFSEAEKWFRSLASNEKAGDLKRKSEDLVLDILNAKKDFKNIKEFSKEILSQTKDDARKTTLSKIIQEADYSEIQEYAKSNEKGDAANKLYSFYQNNRTSPLAKDSLWQAMSLHYSMGKSTDGADLAKEYAKAYPDEKKSLDALKDAANAYVDTGFLILAAQTMEQISEKSPSESDKYIEAASELYLIEGNKKQAIATLSKLLTEKNKARFGKIYSKILLTMTGKENTEEYLKLENKIAALGQEPYASEIKLKRVQHLFNTKKYTEAFNASKPLVSSERGIEDSIRAKARLIQAKVLELEFIAQSTKTTIEKLSVILSLKTEKLDKVQTAFLTSAKISKDPNVQLESLQGLNRIYKNYVETVSHPIIKTKLKDEEKKALDDELAKLTLPIADKLKDTTLKLQQLAKDTKASRSDEIDFTNLPAEETVKARIKNPSAEKLTPFLPVYSDKGTDISFARFQVSKTEKCSFQDSDKSLTTSLLVSKANQCLLTGNMQKAEKIAYQISRNDPKGALGTYYLSVIADLEDKNDKALWLIELSLKKNAEYNFSFYQKARVLYKMKDYAGANKLFIKAYDLKLMAAEVYLTHGIVSYAGGDCFSVVDDFAKLDSKTLYNFGLGAAYAECNAQKGQLAKGFAVIKEQLQFNQYNMDLLLENAYIHDVYQSDTPATLKAYQLVLKSAQLPEVKEWVQRKIEYIKGHRSQVSLIEK